MKQFVISLPPELVDALEHLAGRDADAIGDILREAVRHDLRRRVQTRADKMAQGLAPLRTLLADDLEKAVDWNDLQNRLHHHGYQFVRRGGGLSLRDAEGQHVCNTADLGLSLAQLTRRFKHQIPQSINVVALAS